MQLLLILSIISELKKEFPAVWLVERLLYDTIKTAPGGLYNILEARLISQNAHSSRDIYFQFMKYLRSVISPIIIDRSHWPLILFKKTLKTIDGFYRLCWQNIKERKKPQRRRRGQRGLKNEFIFYFRISRYPKVIDLVYLCQGYRETESGTYR